MSQSRRPLPSRPLSGSFVDSDVPQHPIFALPSHQIESAQCPESSTRDAVDAILFTEAYVGRPLRIWRKKPELARLINDALSDPSGH